MVYGEIFRDKELRKNTLREEIGIEEEEVPERVAVTPLPLAKLLPKDYEENLKRLGILIRKLNQKTRYPILLVETCCQRRVRIRD
jgi:purine-nucleoside phosphorylase